MKTLEDAYGEIWKGKLPGQRPPDQQSIDRVNWTDGLLEKAESGARLIDFGVGSGAMLAKAKAKGYEAMGTDIDDELLAWLKAGGYLVWKDDLNVKVTAGDGDFAVVTSCDVIEHLWNPAQMLREAYRILRPGGKVYVGTPNCANWRRVLSLARGTMFRTSGDPYLKDGGHLAYYGPSDLVEALMEAGFRQVKTNFFKHDPIGADQVTAFRMMGANRQWAEHTYMIMEASK